MLLHVSVYLSLLFDSIAAPLPSSFIFISLCGTFVILALVFLFELSYTTYMVAFLSLLRRMCILPYAYYMWLYPLFVLLLFIFCLLIFSSGSLPDKDILCRLLSHPLLSHPLPCVCLPYVFVSFCFLRPCSFLV